MRLVQFIYNSSASVGAERKDGTIVDFSSGSNTLPSNMVEFLKGGEKALKEASELLARSEHVLEKSQVKLLPPVTNCEKVVCVGMNYKDHCLELNVPIPEEPIVFNKFPSTIIGDGDNIILPKISSTVDWEVELAVIIGKQGKNIKEDDAMNHVAGYTVAHDVSSRDCMKKNGEQCLLGKTYDTFCPIGPVLVTKDEISDPQNLNLKCVVNGEVVQNGNTNQMIFGVSKCIAWVSRVCTLKPGDLLLTGTPPGVGAHRNPPVYFKAGDVAVCEVDKIGKITNTCVDEE